jgi:ParB family chromosome partitioning protein
VANLFGFRKQNKYKASEAVKRGATAYERDATPPPAARSAMLRETSSSTEGISVQSFFSETGSVPLLRSLPDSDISSYRRSYSQTGDNAPRRSVKFLPIKLIKIPPTKEVSLESEDALADSIREVGLIQPIIVRLTVEGNYELIAGARRLKACKLLGRVKIDAIVMPAGDRDLELLALVENTQRRQPHYIDSAYELQQIIDSTGIDVDELSLLSGINHHSIKSRLMLLRLHNLTLDFLRTSFVPERCAFQLLRITNEENQLAAAREMSDRTLDEHGASLIVDKQTEIQKHNKRRITGYISDHRPYVNAVFELVEQMKRCGIDATIVNNDTDSVVSMNIVIPKRMANAG